MKLPLTKTLVCLTSLVLGIWGLTFGQERQKPLSHSHGLLEHRAQQASTIRSLNQHRIGKCSTRHTEELEGVQLDQREFKIPGRYIPGTLCEQYSAVGWEETMVLYLGEGAEEYRELIERAVEVWNETVDLGEDTPLIEITDERPETNRLPRSFWEDTDEEGLANLGDDQSVIYFTPGEESDLWGLCWYRWSYRNAKMLQADIYINTFDEEEYPDHALVLGKKLVDINSTYAAYATYNKTYKVILHELGHAIGVRHIPTIGNVMSRDFGAGGIDQWSAPVALKLFGDLSPSRSPFVERKSSVDPYMAVSKENSKSMDLMDFFTNNAKLGEQEKMALTCIYQY